MMVQQTIKQFSEPSPEELNELPTIRDRVLFIYNRHIDSVDDNKLLFYYYRKYFNRTTDNEESIARTGRAIRQSNKKLLSPHQIIAKEQQRRMCASHWQQQMNT